MTCLQIVATLVKDLEIKKVARGRAYVHRIDDEIKQLIFDTRRLHFFFPPGASPSPRNLVSMFYNFDHLHMYIVRKNRGNYDTYADLE